MMNQNEQPQQQNVLDSAIDLLPQNKEELDSYIRFYYGVYLASQPIEEGNSSPLDFVWDIFQSIVGLRSEITLEDYNFLGLACRGGQKSLACAVLESLAITFDTWRDYFHMASIYDQSKVTYDYVQSFLLKPYVGKIAVKSIMSETISRVGRRLKIGTGTIRAVNSFHGSVVQDEVDLTDRTVFVESKGMLTPSMGQSPLNVCISSRKFAFGNIQEILNKKEESTRKGLPYPMRIHKWGQLEITEKCTDERSGILDKELYVDNEKLIAVKEDEYKRFTENEKHNYVKYKAYHNCYECGMFSFCLGRLKNQKTDNPYLQKIEDVRRLFILDDVDFFKAQRLNRKPSKLGLVLPEINPEIHFCNYEKIYEKFTGQKYVGTVDLDLDTMVKIFKENGCKLYIGLDFGFNMASALLATVDGSDNVYILAEIILQGKMDSEFALTVKNKWGPYGISRGFPDIESPGAIKEFGKFFTMCDKDTQPYSKISKDVDWGIGLIRKQLRVPGTVDTAKLFIHNSCEELCEEVVNYRLKIDRETEEPTDVIQKKRDHSCDSMRYLVVGIFGIIKVGYAYVTDAPAVYERKEGEKQVLVERAPVAGELAQMIGRGDFVDNSEDFEYLEGEYKKKVGGDNIGKGKVKFVMS